MSSLVRVHELAKQYDPPNGVLAVDGVSFDIHEGEIFGLLGPNGAGKTTTISMLSCLLKPTGGDATVDGHSIAREPMEVRKVIGAGPGRDCFCLFVGHCQFGAFVRHQQFPLCSRDFQIAYIVLRKASCAITKSRLQLDVFP